ncbi:hypothetical protein FC093_01135 [Ilyomonas limi]|uniref:Uncharacterized protein n=1 Tax=Ilyomonas limi TaxID=2575867 RepID=A0A4U3L8Q8_9BACT|nr:hypothetical protein [Ilyomonas limi]TKK71658.1 hypothetical protein FC093_01135 [Ilyomonas limi]
MSDINWNELPTSFNLYLTLKGHYYLNELINRFLYYDLIFQDTPIFDINYFNSLKEDFPKSNSEGVRNLEFRKGFVKLFFEYLKTMESKQPNQVQKIYGKVLGNIISNIYEEMERI